MVRAKVVGVVERVQAVRRARAKPLAKPLKAALAKAAVVKPVYRNVMALKAQKEQTV